MDQASASNWLRGRGYEPDGKGGWRKARERPQNPGKGLSEPIPGPKTLVSEAGFKVKPSTDVLKLNKTEAAFHSVLQIRHSGRDFLHVQAYTLKLGDDCRYTPDFFVVTGAGRLIAYEVKGFFRDDAKVKLKTAARMYPYIDFIVVRKLKGVWEETLVSP
jgi:hypothetical protein